MTGFDTVKVNQSLDTTAKHNARKIIVTKHRRLLKTTRRKRHCGCAHLEKVLPLQNRDIVIRIPAVTMRCCHHLNIIISLNLTDQFPGFATGNDAFGIDSRVEQRATQNRFLFYQQHPASSICDL